MHYDTGLHIHNLKEWFFSSHHFVLCVYLSFPIFTKIILFNINSIIFQALDVLLDLSATSSEQSVNGRCLSDSLNYKKDKRFNTENGDNVRDTICFFQLESV